MLFAIQICFLFPLSVMWQLSLKKESYPSFPEVVKKQNLWVCWNLSQTFLVPEVLHVWLACLRLFLQQSFWLYIKQGNQEKLIPILLKNGIGIKRSVENISDMTGLVTFKKKKYCMQLQKAHLLKALQFRTLETELQVVWLTSSQKTNSKITKVTVTYSIRVKFLNIYIP